MLQYVRIVLTVEFRKYLESFSMIWSGVRYISHKQSGLGYFLLNRRVYILGYIEFLDEVIPPYQKRLSIVTQQGLCLTLKLSKLNIIAANLNALEAVQNTWSQSKYLNG